MKILLLVLCLVCSCGAAFSQNYDSGERTITFGISGGSSIAGMYVKGPDQLYIDDEIVEPVSIGVNADIKFNDYFSIKPSLFYQGKGGMVNETGDYDANNKYVLHYLEIPIDFIGHLPLGSNGANLFLGAGPFISIGLSGSNDYDVDGVPAKETIKFGSNGQFKSTDFGLTSVLGFQTASGFDVGANFELGLVNMLQKTDLHIGATSAKTGVFYFSIGQSFK